MMANKRLVENFKQLYQELNRETLSIQLLARVYDSDIVFEDCFHQVKGLDSLSDYFDNLYQNVSYIDFNFEDDWFNEQGAMLSWTMSYQHPKLNAGQIIKVQGASRLSFVNGLVIHHRDYFDAGALLYEHVPLLKRIIRMLKNRMA